MKTANAAFALAFAAFALTLPAQANAETPRPSGVDITEIRTMMDASRERTLALVLQKADDAIALKLAVADVKGEKPAEQVSQTAPFVGF